MQSRKHGSEAADRLLAPELVLQEIRASATASQRSVRRKALLVCIPAGYALGFGAAALSGGPGVVYSLVGAGLGVIAALLIGRHAP